MMERGCSSSGGGDLYSPESSDVALNSIRIVLNHGRQFPMIQYLPRYYELTRKTEKNPGDLQKSLVSP